MTTARLENMVKGWFIGNFDPTIIRTNDVEVAVKEFKKGDYEANHYHKVSTEITVIAVGKVRMNGKEYVKGDIIVTEPYQVTDFEVLEDTITTVVKYPGANNDKYMDELK